MKEQEFEGVIPPIAEKEKRGKKVKRPKDENYVRELDSIVGPSHNINFWDERDGVNLPATY